MDIVNLAGIHKYNALTIFQRVNVILYIDSSKDIIRVKKAGCMSNNFRAAAAP
jgi:hypothetical protein